MNNVVEITDVCKAYGDIKALDHISLTVKEGEMFGLIGPDGAGKSTLYRLLATLLVPDTGNLKVLGLDTVKDYRELRRQIGYMPERFSLYPDMTISENLNFFAALFGVSVKDNYDLIAPIFTQLAKFPDRPAGKLSGGMKQKLALSCALIHRPPILLLDEPTTGVDAVSRNEFWDMLATLRKYGITILVSTSYMDEATRCDRIAMIDHGRILRTDTPEGLVAGLGENLYNAVASDMFRLLAELRKLPEVIDCYTFGATLHVVGREDFNPESVRRKIEAQGLTKVEIYPAQGVIEDLFIKLTRNNE
ncbi:MAG: ABC transporter ATP-binding protein [Muribaculaceae bacterium]|nr:ABC transporter ATP-binding protein [Muribaculaceae bacterium]